MCEGRGISRRGFLEGCFVVTTAVSSGSYLWLNTASGQRIAMAAEGHVERHLDSADIVLDQHLDWVGDEAGLTVSEIKQNAKLSPEVEQWLIEYGQEQAQSEHQAEVVDSFHEQPDVILSDEDFTTLEQASNRLAAVRNYVGFGNFNLISWDDLIAFARNVPVIGAFTVAEMGLMEDLFARDASTLGFLGERTGDQLTTAIARNSVVRVPRSGDFLRRGQAHGLFQQMQKEIGETLILTSGVRGIPKQFDLFLSRARVTRGNLTQAAHSLAPPGYSFHAVGDFDVGKYGLGLANFSAAFSETEVFAGLKRIPEVQIRYDRNNRFGVRFEPWHIRVS